MVPPPRPSWSPSPADGGPHGRRQQSTPSSERECGRRWGQASGGTCPVARPTSRSRRRRGGQKRLCPGTGSRNVLVFSNSSERVRVCACRLAPHTRGPCLSRSPRCPPKPKPGCLSLHVSGTRGPAGRMETDVASGAGLSWGTRGPACPRVTAADGRRGGGSRPWTGMCGVHSSESAKGRG